MSTKSPPGERIILLPLGQSRRFRGLVGLDPGRGLGAQFQRFVELQRRVVARAGALRQFDGVVGLQENVGIGRGGRAGGKRRKRQHGNKGFQTFIRHRAVAPGRRGRLPQSFRDARKFGGYAANRIRRS